MLGKFLSENRAFMRQGGKIGRGRDSTVDNTIQYNTMLLSCCVTKATHTHMQNM